MIVVGRLSVTIVLILTATHSHSESVTQLCDCFCQCQCHSEVALSMSGPPRPSHLHQWQSESSACAVPQTGTGRAGGETRHTADMSRKHRSQCQVAFATGRCLHLAAPPTVHTFERATKPVEGRRLARRRRCQATVLERVSASVHRCRQGVSPSWVAPSIIPDSSVHHRSSPSRR
jgi:hypothetical protein